MKLSFQIAFQKDTVFSALKICLIVGILLNIINQGELILSGQIHKLDPIKLILTFIVPYLVSAYSATRAKLDFRPVEVAPVDIHIECQNCGDNNRELLKGETIPVCSNCLEHTDWKIKKEY